RDKLNQREINPSASSWDRLNAMLTVAEEKKPRKNYGWIYIAASIVGFVLIGTVFFSQSEELIDVRRNDVVIENKKNVKSNKEEKEAMPFKMQSESVAVVSETKSKTVFKQEVKSNNKQKTIITENEIKQNKTEEHLVINQKTEQDIAVKQDGVSADQLLAKAQEAQNERPKASIRVNARNLLAQVDGESEVSFREKVIKTIDKNYKTVKVAIVTRNQQ
ncbi:MAG TPA: hypothetical protein VK476_02395, partial [Flavobacterium sp.]|nr:hypothetical protein [Flavobacterium sp.]